MSIRLERKHTKRENTERFLNAFIYPQFPGMILNYPTLPIKGMWKKALQRKAEFKVSTAQL